MFVENVLQANLASIIEQRDLVEHDLKEYTELRSNILKLKEAKMSKLKTMVDIGYDFYAKAVVPDTSFIYVDIGLGFHAQLSHDEALKFIDAKEKLLVKRFNEFSSKASAISARIKTVLGTISQLIQLSAAQ